MKSILFHINDDSTIEACTTTALELARTTGAHLDCVQVTPFEAYVGSGSFGGAFVIQEVIDAIDARAEAFELEMMARLRDTGVPFDYVRLTGSLEITVAAQSAFADLIVTSRAAHRSSANISTLGRLGTLLHISRIPLCIPASEGGPNIDPNGVAVIGWNGQTETVNAVRGSVALLRHARKVVVVRIGEDDGIVPDRRLLDFLSDNQVNAELRLEQAQSRPKSETLVALAKALDAYLVIGGYSHRRFSEFLFGGVTRKLLTECPVPLMVAH